jgi:hypothetical protein
MLTPVKHPDDTSEDKTGYNRIVKDEHHKDPGETSKWFEKKKNARINGGNKQRDVKKSVPEQQDRIPPDKNAKFFHTS